MNKYTYKMIYTVGYSILDIDLHIVLFFICCLSYTATALIMNCYLVILKTNANH